jgi:Domain of unknown function (DUF3291)
VKVDIAELKVPLTPRTCRTWWTACSSSTRTPEASAGFVWRLKDEAGTATEVAYDFNPQLIVNLSV